MVNLHALTLRAVNLELVPKELVVELVGELHFFCEVVIIVGDYNILDFLKIASLKVVDVLGSEGMVEAVGSRKAASISSISSSLFSTKPCMPLTNKLFYS